MKQLIILPLLALVPSLYAKGFECKALCVVLDSQASTLYYLDSIDIVAGTTKTETHKLLKKKCQKVARSRGFQSGSMTVDRLDFNSRRVDERESSVSNSYSSYGSISISNYHVEVSRGVSIHSGSWQRNFSDRSLDIHISPTSPNVACRENDNVSDGDIPYIGEFEIY